MPAERSSRTKLWIAARAGVHRLAAMLCERSNITYSATGAGFSVTTSTCTSSVTTTLSAATEVAAQAFSSVNAPPASAGGGASIRMTGLLGSSRWLLASATAASSAPTRASTASSGRSLATGSLEPQPQASEAENTKQRPKLELKASSRASRCAPISRVSPKTWHIPQDVFTSDA
jgi:hypothetical protein